MVFNSVVFLFCFLPLSLLLYYLVPGRAKNAVLLAESLIFYCWTGVAFLPLIAVLIVFNYLWALLTARAKSKLRGLLPLAAVLVNLGVLVYFKYANFLIDTVNQVAHLGLAALNIGTVLPLGISYYIFKIISYEVDVCTGKIAPEKNFITFAVYVLFFPQLIVGPIVKYREMADQLHDGANRCTSARAFRRSSECIRSSSPFRAKAPNFDYVLYCKNQKLQFVVGFCRFNTQSSCRRRTLARWSRAGHSPCAATARS